jgi:hypothetical protein
VAKVAIAHKLAVRLYWMLRSGQDYGRMMERGSHVRQSEWRVALDKVEGLVKHNLAVQILCGA